MPHLTFCNNIHRKAFQWLPIEVNENIASFLNTDRDFANFNAICHETHGAVQSHRCGAWRARWKQEYDLPPGVTGQELKAQYQKRRMHLYSKAFEKGLGDAEKNCIGVLKQLVIESFVGPFKSQSNNMIRLQGFVKESNILRTFNACIGKLHQNFNPDLEALQVCLAHCYLNISKSRPRVAFYVFPMSQMAVYSSRRSFLIFLNEGSLTASLVNMQAVQHMINFWRHHMQDALKHLFRELDDKDKPQGWRRPIFDECEGVKGLSRKWKGTYAFISDPDDIDELRETWNYCNETHIERMLIFDDFDEHGLQNIEFDFSEDHNTAPWSKAFEDHLKAMPSPSLCAHNKRMARNRIARSRGAATQKWPNNKPISGTQCGSKVRHSPDPTDKSVPDILDSSTAKKPTTLISREISSPRKGQDFLPFSGSIESAYGSDCFSVSGILHNLPDQCGIPGFQRVSFMKYMTDVPKDETGTTPWTSEDSYYQVDENCYCYEGVVLPGGHIILGRWWAPFEDEEQYCLGPFMLWAVEE